MTPLLIVHSSPNLFPGTSRSDRLAYANLVSPGNCASKQRQFGDLVAAWDSLWVKVHVHRDVEGSGSRSCMPSSTKRTEL
jgi:hypothetical protein